MADQLPKRWNLTVVKVTILPPRTRCNYKSNSFLSEWTCHTRTLGRSMPPSFHPLLKKNVKYWKIIASKMWPLPEKWTFSYQKYCLKFRPKSSITTRRCSELSAETQKRWRGRVPPTAEETFSGFSRCQWETTGLILLWGYTRRPLRNWLHHQRLGFQVLWAALN